MPILEPSVTKKQALIVTAPEGIILTMTAKELFAARLNEALETSGLNVPPKGRGRQTFVGQLFGVGQKGARKWLEAEGFPTLEKSAEIAKRLNVSLEWLLTGRGAKRMTEETNPDAMSVLEMWYKLPPHLQEQWVKYGEFLMGDVPPAVRLEPGRISKKVQ